MYKPSNLTKKERQQIRVFAEQKRGQYALGKGPIGEFMFKFVRDLGIQLIYTLIPLGLEGQDNFCGCYASFEEKDGNFRFIGLNTNECLDKQNFILAHELYHHWERSSQKVCRNLDELDADDLEEDKANLFAAEFLLPFDKLNEEVNRATKYGEEELRHWDSIRLLTFIARLHCDYQLPYKAIVRSLYEAEEITAEQLRQLFKENHREPTGLYHQIGKRLNPSVFNRLNEATLAEGTDGDTLFDMKLLYTKGIVSMKELSDDLRLFGRTLADVQLESEIDEESVCEIEALLRELEE